MSKIWIVEQTSKPRPDTYAFFVEADEIGKAHQWGRAFFGKGVSFRVRETNNLEKQIMGVHQIHQADELVLYIETP